MQSLTVRSPWSLVLCDLISGAILLIWLATIQSCPAQETPTAGQDKKPATASPQGGGGAAGNPSKMMGEMRGRMGGMTGGRMGMMGQMGGGMGDKPASAAEPTLEEMLNKALKDNPDIRVAEAKVREAEAELNRTRLQVTQKVLAFHHTRESQKAIVKVAEEDLQRIQKLEASKAVSQEDVKQAQQRLSAAKAKLAEVEAEMPYLLGQHKTRVLSFRPSADGKTMVLHTEEGNLADIATSIRFEAVKVPKVEPETVVNFSNQERTTIADKVRKALDTKVTVDYHDKPVEEILKDLEKKVPDLSFHGPGVAFPVTVKGSFSLKALLQLIQDTCFYELGSDPQTGYSFAVRDYGLLFAPDNRIPSGAIRLQDLQKEKTPVHKDKKPDEQKK